VRRRSRVEVTELTEGIKHTKQRTPDSGFSFLCARKEAQGVQSTVTCPSENNRSEKALRTPSRTALLLRDIDGYERSPTQAVATARE
jgi:hypothetical protein